MRMGLNIVSFCLWIVIGVSCCLNVCNGQKRLKPEVFYDGVMNGSAFDAIVDVRGIGEWESGHIPNATFIEGLSTNAGPMPYLKGCEECTLVVYCSSGTRAANAITRLINIYGFENATIYNGQGAAPWVDAGYPLVTTPSQTANCHQPNNENKLSYVCIDRGNEPNTKSSTTTTLLSSTSVVITALLSVSMTYFL